MGNIVITEKLREKLVKSKLFEFDDNAKIFTKIPSEGEFLEILKNNEDSNQNRLTDEELTILKKIQNEIEKEIQKESEKVNKDQTVKDKIAKNKFNSFLANTQTRQPRIINTKVVTRVKGRSIENKNQKSEEIVEDEKDKKDHDNLQQKADKQKLGIRTAKQQQMPKSLDKNVALQVKGAKNIFEKKDKNLENIDYEDAVIDGIEFVEDNTIDKSKGDYIFFDNEDKLLQKTSVITKNEFISLSNEAAKIAIENRNSPQKINSFTQKDSTLLNYVENKMKEKGAKSGAMALISPIDEKHPEKKQLDCLVVGEPDIKIYLNVSLNGKKERWELDPQTGEVTREDGTIIDKSKLKNIKIPDLCKRNEISKSQEKNEEILTKEDEERLDAVSGISAEKSLKSIVDKNNIPITPATPGSDNSFVNNLNKSRENNNEAEKIPTAKIITK